MKDETEFLRRARAAEINAHHHGRLVLEAKYGRVWNLDQLTQEFDIEGFRSPLVVVRRRSDGKLGSMEFQHEPRFYFNYEPHK